MPRLRAIRPWQYGLVCSVLLASVPAALARAQDTTARAPDAGTGYEWRDSRFDVTRRQYESPLFLPPPSNVETVYELTDDGRGYNVYERVGGRDVRNPSYITREEYEQLQRRRQIENYFRRKSYLSGQAGIDGRLVPQFNVNSGLFRDVFGSGKIDIRPNVTALVDLGIRTNVLQNPSLPIRQQRSSFFDFRQQIQMNVTGQIGERLRIRANYDTEATFDFENQFKVEYVGMEDDVLKKIEVGNVSLPLNGTLITGGQNLWGLKMQFQIGPAMVTAVASQQRGRTNELTLRGATANTEFRKKVSDYDEYRHFFLSHYFRSLYEQSLSNLPLQLSRINVTRVEVYITNRSAASTQANRNAVGLVDLGEGSTGGVRFNPAVAVTGALAANGANNVYQLVTQAAGARQYANTVNVLQGLPGVGFRNGFDFELVQNMRRLTETEYTLNPQLGYISLNSRLQQNDVLFVAFEYTVAGQPGVFKVGEFSNDVPADANNTSVLFLKMLKPSAVRPTYVDAGVRRPFPTWDLMMKNIYNLGAFNISPQDFRLDIVYESTDGKGDINYLPSATAPARPLIQLLALDQLTNNNEAGPDNRFDFLPGITILPDKGLVIFPVLEPFGDYLAREVLGNNPADTALFAFPELYRLTQVDAFTLFPEKDRFKFRGTYTADGGGGATDVDLNAAQIVPGSVRVTAGGGVLTEGIDYTVDYQIGRVTLLNNGLRATGAEIKITWESNVLFGIDQKTLLGARVDYRLSKYFQLGSTLLYLNERPLINKIVIGEEPMSNFLWGLDGTYTAPLPGLTRALDKLPFYTTNAPSAISVVGEFAQLQPGFPSAIATDRERGIAYIDDFEGTQTFLPLGESTVNWQLASIPSVLPVPAPSGLNSRLDSLRRGFTRAKLAWYLIDPRFYDAPEQFGLNNQSPTLNDNYSRRVSIPELFPNRTVATSDLLQTFDLHYFPAERGPYNYEFRASALNPDGSFRQPEDNWAGIMRRTTGTIDFEAANFEYLEFWLMDPFMDTPSAPGGELYLNLGRVSEDVLPDSRLSYENGLPIDAATNAANVAQDITPWARVPARQANTAAFDNSQDARRFQDVGLDGVGSVNGTGDESAFFQDFLTQAAAAGIGGGALQALQADPSQDDFRFWADYEGGTDILTRYRNFNGLENNSPVGSSADNFTRSAKLTPDAEDINQDGTPNLTESYWQYRVQMRPGALQVGQNYIIDRQVREVRLPNQTTTTATWYLFRVPLRAEDRTAIGDIQDFKSIDFVRMYLADFPQEVVLRMAQFRLVSTQWRSLNRAVRFDTLAVTDNSELRLGTVNIEENASKVPFPYRIPPEIVRQGVPASPIPNQLQNEQSLQLQVRNLPDGEARGAFKNLALDLRFYKRLKMWVHAEATDGVLGTGDGNFRNAGEATVFIRIGGDYSNNFYEYEVPLAPSVLGDLSVQNIWRPENQIDVALDELTGVKVQRNTAGADFTQRYTVTLANGHRITVVGNPQLNNTKVAFIGVRNTPDGQGQMSLEVWVNELRVTDFDTYPGWAASARMNVRLADLGDVQLSGSRVTPGFGDVQSRIWERSLDDRSQWDIATNLQLGKLLPEKAGLEIPLFFSYGERLIEPRYNPIDPDVRLDTRLENTPESERQEVYDQSVEYQRNISYAVNNLRKIRVRPDAKPRFWDIENFSFSYAFSEVFLRNAQIESRTQQYYNGSITYQFSFNPKNYRPFKGKRGKSNLLTEFNFYLVPQQIGFRIEGNRIYEEEILRSLPGTDYLITPAYVQNFTVTRSYTLRWDLTRSLSLTYTGTDISRVDEPRGRLDTRAKRDSLWRNFFNAGREGYFNWLNFGRTINFVQNIAVTYRLPFQYVKPLNWISANGGYTADYRWVTSALQNTEFGNTIANQRTIQGDVQLNFSSLYRKFPFIERLLRPIPRRNIYSEADSSRRRGDGGNIAARNTLKAFGGLAFAVQNFDVNYLRTDGTVLPGFLPGPDLFGIDADWVDPTTGQRYLAPGIDFVLGVQPALTREGWFATAVARGWISSDPRLAAQFGQTSSEQLNLRSSVQLFRGLRVDLTGNRTVTTNASGLFGFDADANDFLLSNEIGGGTHNITFVAAHTAFRSGDDLFREFGRARAIISERLRQANPNYDALPGAGRTAGGLWNGYTATSQDVLVPAFLATYGPSSPGGIGLTAFPNLPLPNWRVSYQGLSDVWFMKTIFKTVTLTHAYTSTYTLNYLRNLRAADDNGDGFVDTFEPTPTDSSLVNFQPKEVIQNVLINESFVPLLGVNLVFRNGISALLDYKRIRTLLLNVGALQLTETLNTEWTLNLQWKKDRGSMPISLFGRLIEVKNDLTIRLEATIRDTRIQNRRLESLLPPEPTGGNRGFTLKPSVDYNISTQLTARAYYEFTSNAPVLSTSFPSRYTAFGVQLRFTLQ